MVLFDPLPFLNILFVFSIEAQNIGVQSWTPWVMPQTTSLLRYEAIPIHPLPPSYFKFFSFCLLKRAFSLLMLSTMIRSLCVSRRALNFFSWFEYLIVSLKVELQRIHIKSQLHFNTSVFPRLIRPVDLPIHLKRLLTVIIEKKTSL